MPAMLISRLARAPPAETMQTPESRCLTNCSQADERLSLFGELSSAERHASASERRGGTGVAVCSVPHAVHPARSEFLQTHQELPPSKGEAFPCLL
jgi:hypothetical protein